MRFYGPEAWAFGVVVLGGAALVALFLCARREGPREGGAPIYVAGAVVGAAYALATLEAVGAIELGLPLAAGALAGMAA